MLYALRILSIAFISLYISLRTMIESSFDTAMSAAVSSSRILLAVLRSRDKIQISSADFPDANSMFISLTRLVNLLL